MYKRQVHVLGASQSDVTVNVTVAEPPQAFGAPVLLLVKTGLQPPLVIMKSAILKNVERGLM